MVTKYQVVSLGLIPSLVPRPTDWPTNKKTKFPSTFDFISPFQRVWKVHNDYIAMITIISISLSSIFEILKTSRKYSAKNPTMAAQIPNQFSKMCSCSSDGYVRQNRPLKFPLKVFLSPPKHRIQILIWNSRPLKIFRIK